MYLCCLGKVKAQDDLDLGISMAENYVFPELALHIKKKHITRMKISVVDWLHYYIVVCPRAYPP